MPSVRNLVIWPRAFTDCSVTFLERKTLKQSRLYRAQNGTTPASETEVALKDNVASAGNLSSAKCSRYRSFTFLPARKSVCSLARRGIVAKSSADSSAQAKSSHCRDCRAAKFRNLRAFRFAPLSERPRNWVKVPIQVKSCAVVSVDNREPLNAWQPAQLQPHGLRDVDVMHVQDFPGVVLQRGFQPRGE